MALKEDVSWFQIRAMHLSAVHHACLAASLPVTPGDDERIAGSVRKLEPAIITVRTRLQLIMYNEIALPLFT